MWLRAQRDRSVGSYNPSAVMRLWGTLPRVSTREPVGGPEAGQGRNGGFGAGRHPGAVRRPQPPVQREHRGGTCTARGSGGRHRGPAEAVSPAACPPPPHTHTQCRDEGVCTCHVFLSRSAEWVIPGRKTTHWTPAARPRGFRVPSICSLMGSPYACLWALSASGSRLATQGCPSLGKPHPAAAHLVRPLHIYDRPAAADREMSNG